MSMSTSMRGEPLTERRRTEKMGAMPTTMTTAGMASGSRHRNSMGRFMAGTRRYAQVIVGTRSSSTPSTVRAAIWSVTMIAATRLRSRPMASQASSVRAPPASRVENSSIANSGSSM